MLIVQITLYAISIWFGLYLLRRNFTKAGMRYAALGLLAYGLTLGANTLVTAGADPALRWRDALIVLPAIFWVGAVLNLTPQPPNRYLNIGLPLIAVLVFGAGMLSQTTYMVAQAIAVVMASGALLIVLNAFRQDIPKRPLITALTATLFFALGVGLLFMPTGLPGISETLLLLAIGFDLILLGIAVSVFDAYDEGQALWRDVLRSMIETGVVGLIIAGQIVVVMTIADADSLPFIVLLLTLLLTVFALMMLGRKAQKTLNQLVLVTDDGANMRRESLDLLAVAEALPRQQPTFNLDTLNDKDFYRLTRRALSHISDLSKLAASPLIHLPVVDGYVNGDSTTLARANALRTLLTESIEQLKPEGEGVFGTSEAWRYYNALYFPYVMGLKPFSRRFIPEAYDRTTQEALAWFQSQVPERTLYNWQNKGAELIAQLLREQHIH